MSINTNTFVGVCGLIYIGLLLFISVLKEGWVIKTVNSGQSSYIYHLI